VFTGLIAELGEVQALERDGGGLTLTVRTGLADELQEGDSIAVNGVCLTASELTPEGFSAQAMSETLSRSTLGDLRAGAPVNLELALRVGERLGGHVVQGHVDGTGAVEGVEQQGFARELRIGVQPALMPYLALKGSVAVDGVSLTVSDLHERSFAVSLIPETLQRTTLGRAAPGDRVNLEVDILAKHVERLLAARA
jgi:riboflavin synthase